MGVGIGLALMDDVGLALTAFAMIWVGLVGVSYWLGFPDSRAPLGQRVRLTLLPAIVFTGVFFFLAALVDHGTEGPCVRIVNGEPFDC